MEWPWLVFFSKRARKKKNTILNEVQAQFAGFGKILLDWASLDFSWVCNGSLPSQISSPKKNGESWWPWIYRCQLSAWIFYLCKIKWRPLGGLKGQDLQFKKQACYKIKVTELQFPSWCGSKAADRIKYTIVIMNSSQSQTANQKNIFSVYHRFDFRNMFNLFSFKKTIAVDILKRKNRKWKINRRFFGKTPKKQQVCNIFFIHVDILKRKKAKIKNKPTICLKMTQTWDLFIKSSIYRHFERKKRKSKIDRFFDRIITRKKNAMFFTKKPSV